MQLSIFILGVIGITAQAVFLREVLAVFRAGELTIGAALLFWLLWTSAGSGILGRISARIGDPDRWFHSLLPWYGVLGYFGVSIVGSVPYIVRLTPGELVPYDLQFIAVALVFLPFNILGGFLFTLGVKSLESVDSPSAGRAYTLEAFGAALAGAVVSLILVSLISNSTLALACPLIGIVTVIMWGIRRRTAGCIYRLILPVAFLAAVFLWNERASEYYYRGQTLLGEKDTKYGRLRVTERGEQITFYSDASSLFSAPDPETSEHTAHIPMLAAENPSSVLVLGGGLGGVIDEVLKYQSAERITCVELDPGLFELADRFLVEEWKRDPRVETIFTDGRAFLERTGRRFDVIVMNMPAPLSGVTNRYYTKEFFRLAASRLSERGILAFSLTGAENYIPDDLAFFLASIRATLSEAFPSVTVLPGLKCRFIASNSPGTVDSLSWEHLVGRRKQLGIETSYVRDYFLRFTMSPLRVQFLTESLDAVKSPAINRDTKPTGYFLRTVVQGYLENSRIIGFTASLANSGILIAIIIAGIVITALFAGIPGKGAVRRTVIAAVMSVGITEISLEVLAIMAYQSVFGYLYGRIALLVGFYMGGLAAGAFAGTRLVERGLASTKLLSYIQAGLAVIPLLWALILWRHSAFPGSIPALEICFYLLTALSGIAGGLQFPVADSLYRISSPGKRAGLGAIYGVDLAGSSIGALITGSLMIPILGMIPVLIFFSVLNAVTAGVLWIRNLTG